MEGLRTSRVLVVDDKLEEALPFIQAIAKHGIGTLYFSGVKEEELPEEGNKLTGIRLAALDMNLGANENAEIPEILSGILSALDRLIDAKNGPYLAIAWTKHKEVVDEFKERVKDIACPPIDVITMGKKREEEDEVGGQSDLDEVFSKIRVAMDGCYPLRLLSYWEQQVHESSGSVMELMPGVKDWSGRSQQALALLLGSSTGHDDPLEAQLGALLSGFNSLQLDAIETATGSLPESEIAPLILPLQNISPDASSNSKPLMNRRLLFTRPEAGVAPGNIYVPCDPGAIVSKEDVLFDITQKGKASELEETSILLAMEVSAVCDYQQHKRKVFRFIYGIALPSDKLGLLQMGGRAEFLRKIPVSAFNDGPLEGDLAIVWNSRFVISTPFLMVPEGCALLRLRYAPLVDTQAWLGGQVNRPGYLSV